MYYKPYEFKLWNGLSAYVLSWNVRVEITPATDKTQPISVSYSLHSKYSSSPSSSHTRTSTSALLSKPSNASPLFKDDELAVLSKGLVASM